MSQDTSALESLLDPKKWTPTMTSPARHVRTVDDHRLLEAARAELAALRAAPRAEGPPPRERICSLCHAQVIPEDHEGFCDWCQREIDGDSESALSEGCRLAAEACSLVTTYRPASSPAARGTQTEALAADAFDPDGDDEDDDGMDVVTRMQNDEQMFEDREHE